MVDISVDTMDRVSGGAAQFLARGGPGPWHKFIQAIVRPEIDEAGDRVGQIGLGVDAVAAVLLTNCFLPVSVRPRPPCAACM